MGKIKKVSREVVTNTKVLNTKNKISKIKSTAATTIKEKIRKNLGVKDPKKSTLKSNKNKLAAFVEENTATTVTKKNKKVENKEVNKENKKGTKRKDAAVVSEEVQNVQITPNKKSKLGLKKALQTFNNVEKTTVQKSAAENQGVSNYKALEDQFNIEGSTVETAFEAVDKLLKEESEKHNKLFDDQQPIFLQITSMKIPKCPPRIARFPLKHSLYSKFSDICFIVPDIPNNEVEQVVDHYETLFKNNGVRNIKTILPFRQLRAEYGEHELKRRLVELYDAFLVDGRISGRVTHFLGSIFYKKRNVPIPLKMQPTTKLQRNVKIALKKTPLQINPHGDTSTIQISHSQMKNFEKIGNFWSVIQNLNKEFPGGWENIRSLHLKGSTTMAVPVYLNLSKY